MEPRDWIALVAVVITGITAAISMFLQSKSNKRAMEQTERLADVGAERALAQWLRDRRADLYIELSAAINARYAMIETATSQCGDRTARVGAIVHAPTPEEDARSKHFMASLRVLGSDDILDRYMDFQLAADTEESRWVDLPQAWRGLMAAHQEVHAAIRQEIGKLSN